MTEASSRADFAFRLSVLVTPTKSGGSLHKVLGSLARDSFDFQGIELVVVVPEDRHDSHLETLADRLRSQGLCVQLRTVAPGGAADVPAWRAIAFGMARGMVRIFLEDNATIEKGWWRAWDAMAARDDWTIATGSVVADESGLSRAAVGVFFCEYGLFVPKNGHGSPLPLKRVAGNHWAVHCGRLSLPTAEPEIDEHVWTHRLVAPGQKPARNDQAVVCCRRQVGGFEAIVERARQGFRFGRDECRRARVLRRIKMVHGGHAIVVVQFVRLVGVVAIRRSHRRLLVRSLPWTIALLKAWSFAEWAGWCYGSFESLFHANLQNRAEPGGEGPKGSAAVQGRIVKAHEPASKLLPGVHSTRSHVDRHFRIPS